MGRDFIASYLDGNVADAINAALVDSAGTSAMDDTNNAARVSVVSGSVTITDPTAGLGTGRKTVTTAGTAVALVGSSTPCTWVAITAETDNTDLVVVGDSNVVGLLATRRGTPLYPGDSVVFPIDDLQDVYLDSLVNGEGATFFYGTT